MVSVGEAVKLINTYVLRMPREKAGIDSLMGKVLAETIKAENDMPPFDRVAMDGIAIKYESYQSGWRDFRIEGMQPAGTPRLTLQDPQNCIEVMTGAMLPIGCDTVVRIEDISVSNRIARVKLQTVNKGDHVHLRSHDVKKGEILLNPGVTISAAEISILASQGRASAEVYTFPRIAIISTGNELVDIHDRPLPHQIRRSNAYVLQAALKAMGASPSTPFHFPDDQNVMERELLKIMTDHEVIILSGGSSKGKFDYVPKVLEVVGVECQFHEISQKPGKPMWFGVTKKQMVFALPGNPVSTFLCFYKYLKPWFEKNMGIEAPTLTAALDEDYSFFPDLTYFLQVKVRVDNGVLKATPVTGGGSGDLVNLKLADGFLELPLEQKQFKAGESFPFIPFRPI